MRSDIRPGMNIAKLQEDQEKLGYRRRLWTTQSDLVGSSALVQSSAENRYLDASLGNLAIFTMLLGLHHLMFATSCFFGSFYRRLQYFKTTISVLIAESVLPWPHVSN
ncbi:hypothetical protein GYMLUDRAFT_629181 [Collybiopsis luxurians FD-317 M1]|nr:hypothetical protein GYMLUDRAFT_629181 [Collybiopsis luxurians FD-317 M1]